MEARRQEVVEGGGIIGRREGDDADAPPGMDDLRDIGRHVADEAPAELRGLISAQRRDQACLTLPTRGAFAIKTKAVSRSSTAHRVRDQ